MGPVVGLTRPNGASYQGFQLDKYEDLLSSCSIYLDCNQEKKYG